MKKILLTAVATINIVMLASISVNANLVVNGSFEADIFNGTGSNYTLGLIGNDVTGWFIPDGDGTYPWGLRNGNPFGTTPFGEQFLVLGRWSSVGTPDEFSIQQTLTGLTSGASYNLSFAIASESGCCSEVEVSFLDGSSTPAQNFFASNSGSFWTDWTAKTMNFIAADNSVTLQFKNINPTIDGGVDLGLDNVDVDVEVVPIPVTIVLLGSGLAVLGVLRRKIKI